MKKRSIALVMSVIMLFGVVAGTIAWLSDKDGPVVNTFVAGDIEIELDESPLNADGITIQEVAEDDRVKINNNYKLIPGNVLEKDPQVRVLDESEACWLFIEVIKSTGFDNYMTFEIADGWTAVPGQTGVYYREVAALYGEDNDDTMESTNTAKYQVIKNDKVNVIETLKKADLEAITTDPTLTINAYAVQKANVTTVADAWSIAKTGAKPVAP